MIQLKHTGIFFPCVVEEYWRTPLLKALSKYCPVVFCRLVPLSSLVRVVKDGRLIQPEILGEQLFRVSLPLLPLGGKWKGIAGLNRYRFRTLMAKMSQRLSIASPILWFSHPSYLEVIGYPGGAALIFDCVDKYTAYPLMTDDDRENLLGNERKLAEKAHLIFCVSMKLKEKMDKWGYSGKAYYFPNATSWASTKCDREAILDEFKPQELVDIRRPIIGMTGMLNERVDFKLIGDLARKRPEWSFILIGPFADGTMNEKDESVQLLLQISNVHLLGARPHARLPLYIQQFDVCIIPYVRNALNDHCSPLKLYDYLASGRPIVSSDISEAVLFGETVRVAHSAVEFERQIDKSLAESKGEPSRRIAVAKAHTWERRAQDMFSVLQKAFYQS